MKTPQRQTNALHCASADSYLSSIFNNTALLFYETNKFDIVQEQVEELWVVCGYNTKGARSLACGEQTHFSALASPAEKIFSRRVKQNPKNASALRRLRGAMPFVTKWWCELMDKSVEREFDPSRNSSFRINLTLSIFLIRNLTDIHCPVTQLTFFWELRIADSVMSSSRDP